MENSLFCVSCFLKVRGDIVKCNASSHEFLSLIKSKDYDNYCYDCSLGIKEGIKKNCGKCKKVFYTSTKSYINKTFCYDCYLIETGKETKCTTCSKLIFVKAEIYPGKRSFMTVIFIITKKSYNITIDN